MPFGYEQDIIGEIDKKSLQAIQKCGNRTFFLGTFKHGAYDQIWQGYAYNDVANPYLFAGNLTSTANDKYKPQFHVVGDKIYYVWYSYCGGSRHQIVTGVSGIHGEDFVATQRTSGTSYWNWNPQLYVVGTKIYYTWQRAPHAGTLIPQVATAVMNTDGTGWSMATRTSYGTTGGIGGPQLQVDDSYIYYVWTKSYALGDNRITTAKMHIAGSGWAAVERTAGSSNGRVQQHVFNGNIYYVYQKDVWPTEPNYQIWTAKMTTGGAGWAATQRVLSEIRSSPQLDVVEGKLQYTYLLWPSARTQIFTASMNLDGSGWVANQRTITDDLKSDPRLDELNYGWMAENWYKNPWLSVPITVATGDATDIEKNSANGFGVVQTGDDVKRRGFCWNKTGNPTINDDSVIEYNTDFGTGNFALAMTGLDPGTKYYVRAFAYDVDYIYGDQDVEFATKPVAPTNVLATDGVHTDKVVITWTKSEEATGYQVYRDGVALGWLGDVATFNDTEADAPTITHGSVGASDGASVAFVALSNSGASASDGTTHVYKVRAKNAAGESEDSETDTGYRSVGVLTYQWYRSAGDSDATYSMIPGATSSTHSDIDAPGPTITPGSALASDGEHGTHVALSISGQSADVGEGRYFVCYHTAEGAIPDFTQYSDRGYRGVSSLTYQWQRSAADDDSNYSNISGAIAASYNDAAAPENGDNRYYKCVLNAIGSVQQISTVDGGYRLSEDVTTQAVSDVGIEHAKGNGTTSGANITQRGFKVRLTFSGTLQEYIDHGIAGFVGTAYYNSSTGKWEGSLTKTVTESGTFTEGVYTGDLGHFPVALTSDKLFADETYDCRAYATINGTTYYGGYVEFTTDSHPAGEVSDDVISPELPIIEPVDPLEPLPEPDPWKDIPFVYDPWEFPNIVFPPWEDPTFNWYPEPGIDPDITFGRTFSAFMRRLDTKKDWKTLREKCTIYQENMNQFTLTVNHNMLVLKNLVNDIIAYVNEDVYPSDLKLMDSCQQLTPLYLEFISPGGFKNIINDFRLKDTYNAYNLNVNFRKLLNSLNSLSEGDYSVKPISYNASEYLDIQPTAKRMILHLDDMSRKSREVRKLIVLNIRRIFTYV